MVESLPDNLDELIELANGRAHVPEERRIQVISAMGNLLSDEKESLHAPRGILCLIDLVKNESSPRMVSHCIGVLGRIRAVSAVMTLIDVALGANIVLFEGPPAQRFAKTDEALRLRITAVKALGRLQDERSLIPLMSLLNDKTVNTRLRMAAAESLGQAGDPHALHSLMDILEDDREKSIYLRESSAKALGMLGDIRAIDSLLNVLESKRGIRDKFDFLKEQTIEAIGRIMGRGSESRKVMASLIQSLKDEASSIRLAAVEALAETEDPKCLEPLREMLFDPHDDVAIAAVAAIYHIGGEEAIRELLRMENIPQFLREELEAYIP